MKKLVVGSLMGVLITLGWGTSGVGQEVATPRGELQIVDNSGGNWAWLDWNVFDHLLEVDKEESWCRVWRRAGAGSMTAR